MSTPVPLLVIHRRNRIEELAGLPRGCWVEIDIEIHEGTPYLIHDPLTAPPAQTNPVPDKLAAYIPAALKAGVAGFIVDCKRENAEQFVKPLLAQNKVTDFYFLNEMEVQADIFQEQNATHQNGIRVWKYRNADDVIRIAEDMKKAGQAAPQWVWVDCWQRGLLQDIARAYRPVSGAQAQKLQALGVKLCICSPELYVHRYGADYSADELTVFYQGVLRYRQELEREGVNGDAVCTKFPWLWTRDLALLQKAGNKIGTLDFRAYREITEADVRGLLAA